MKKTLLLLLLLMPSFAYADDFIEDETVVVSDNYEEVAEGIICLNYTNKDYQIKSCRFNASLIFVDRISGQYKQVTGHNFTRLLAWQKVSLCFDMQDHLFVYNPWSGERMDDNWELSSHSGSTALCLSEYPSV
ncbi:MAG: hypothetical protein AB8G05_13105 [Oligoflexales bacterium]